MLVESVLWSQVFTHGSQEAESKEQGPDGPSKSMPPVISLPSTKPRLLSIPPPPTSSASQGQGLAFMWAFRGLIQSRTSTWIPKTV